jgi:glyoxylase-like metal-dependent hydrolase (beta-lactamase superfamily II)
MSMDGVEDAEVLDRPARPHLVYPLGDPPEAGVAREIAPGVHWIRMPLPFALKWINLWLIEDGDGWTIVDTGIAIEETREHWRKIFEATLGGRPVTRVICTHMHPDHMGLAGWICRKFDAPLWMSRLEYTTGRVLVADTGREAPEEGVKFYRAAGWGEDALDSYKVRFGGFGKLVSRVPDA